MSMGGNHRLFIKRPFPYFVRSVHYFVDIIALGSALMLEVSSSWMSD